MTIKECPDYKCPMTAFKTRCKKHRDDCPNYVHIRGKMPQSEEDIDMYDCALKWAPTLAIELSQRMNQMGATMDSFRNELVKAQDTHNQIMAHGVNVALAWEDEREQLMAGENPKLVNGDGSS